MNPLDNLSPRTCNAASFRQRPYGDNRGEEEILNSILKEKQIMKYLGLVAIVLVMLISPVYASIIGDTVHIEWVLIPDFGNVLPSTNAVVVDPGVEWILPPGIGVDSIDIGNGFITLQAGNSGWWSTTFNGFTFTDLTKDANFTSFSLFSATGELPPNMPVLSFSSNMLSVNFGASGSPPTPGEGEGQLYTFAYTTGAAAVPEPATLLLVGAGLAGIGIVRKRISA